MIGKSNENSFVKVCLPLDESETALCSNQDEPCSQRAAYVEQEKKKNEDYIEKIKTSYFSGKKKKQGTQKSQEPKDKDKNTNTMFQNLNK